MSEANGRRPVVQGYPRRIGPTAENAYPTVGSGAAAILAADPNWRPPYASGKGPSLKPRVADNYLGLEGYINALRMVESSGGRNLRNPNSSARGPLQLMPSKAKELGVDLNNYGAHEAAVREIGAPRDMALLKANNFAPTYANLYALHWAGRTGGLRILQADDREPAVNVIGEAAIKSNSLPHDITTGQLKQWLAKRGIMDDAPAGARVTVSRPLLEGRPRAEQDGLASTLEMFFPQLLR
jgi:hypothetical protein